MGEGLGGILIEIAIGFFGFLLPLALIARRAGHSPFLAAWALIPFIGFLVVLRVLARGRWPVEERP